MPVRINLKELFGSDSQTVTVDKLNFNFNKLLELGIGLEGIKGITGGTGSIGPSGIKGDQGEKGNQWYVGSSDPNLTTFPGLMDEDFYVLSDTSQIWQYDLETDTWIVVIDLGLIVNDYLTTAGTTFVRGFGEGSPQDSRYIMFPNRGNSITDQQGDLSGSGLTNNDILLLSNFNETLQSTVLDISNDLSDTDKYYTAIQKIYVDRSNAIDKRYHLELGSLNDVAPLGTPFALSSLNENLKLRHEYKNGIYNGVFSLTKLESDIPSSILHNGIFDFQYAKFNAIGPVQKEGFVQMGSRYAHLAMGRSYVEFDGINFNVSGVGNGGIGIGENFNNILPNINGGNYLVIKTDDTGVNGIILDTNTYQDNGNIEQLGTGSPDIKTSASKLGYGIDHAINTYGNSAIVVSGNYIYQAEGTSAIPGSLENLDDINFKGSLFASDITNSNVPLNASALNATGMSTSAGNKIPVGAAICDMDTIGNYLYCVYNQNNKVYTPITAGPTLYHQTNLQIIRFTPESGADFDVLGAIGLVDASYPLNGAHRIKVVGNRAIVVSNNLRHWGDIGDSSTLSLYNTGGKISAVDITDPIYPRISASVSGTRQHHLDLAISGNHAFTVSIILDPVVGIQFDGYQVVLTSYDLTETGINLGTQMNVQLLASGNNVGESNYNNVSQFNKFGAITTSGNHIFIAYQNLLYTYKRDGIAGALTLIDITAYHTDVDIRSMDIEVVNESLYILGATGNPTSAYAPTNTSVVKINISDVSTPVIISTTILNEESASKFVISGNNLYTNITRGNGANGYLLPIEIDGIKSDAANIGSIKSTRLNVASSATIGNSLNVGHSINIGKGGVTSIGHVSGVTMSTSNLHVYKDNTDTVGGMIKVEQGTSTTSEDPIIEFIQSNSNFTGAKSYVIGIDASDSKKFKIGESNNFAGSGSIAFTYDGATNRVGIFNDIPAYSLDVTGTLHVTSTVLINTTGSGPWPNTTRLSVGGKINVGNIESNVDSGNNYMFLKTPGPNVGVFFQNAGGFAQARSLYMDSAYNLVTGGNAGNTFTNFFLNGTVAQFKGINLEVTTGNAFKPGGGTWAVISDIKLKKDVVTISNALDTISQLRGVNFVWKKDGTVDAGFIANEVGQLFPNWVNDTKMDESYVEDGILEEGETVKSMNLPNEFFALVVESIKELKSENEAKDMIIESLTNRITAIEASLGL